MRARCERRADGDQSVGVEPSLDKDQRVNGEPSAVEK